MARDLAFIQEQQKRAERDVTLDLGFVPEPVYVGTPTWDVSDRETITGSAEHIAERMRVMQPLGVNHLQVRFRSRGVAEHLEQMSAWYEDVAPLLD
jgi:hypothetical protein